ncbi:MAG: hypothetical protein A2086_03320 [Spirochaetes bacterium GWD1_27_9]|nr:MAG: hypothetical protein A2Z98_12550 [Spirochaetes bacterium GWB1_27_13]OHD45279.1 MAG: hypothetical protein A2086_03320 [Spirochaetes bacterium GWD1_27_9]
MTLSLIVFNFGLTCQEKQENQTQKKPWWQKTTTKKTWWQMNEFEKFCKYQEAKSIAKGYRTLYQTARKISLKRAEQLKSNVTFLETQKEWRPRWGFGVGANFLIDSKLYLDANASLKFYYFPIKNIFLSPEINLKFYPDWGAGAGFTVGFIFGGEKKTGVF